MIRRFYRSTLCLGTILTILTVSACGGSSDSNISTGMGSAQNSVTYGETGDYQAGSIDEGLLFDEPPMTEEATEEGFVEEAPPVDAQRQIEVNPFIQTMQDNLSTFALDVDTASYAAARNYITNNELPPSNTVRVEEFVNYFDYNYPAPEQDAFGIYIDAVTTPFGSDKTHIARVGIQGKNIDAGQRDDASLVFVIDVSGSMEVYNRLPLVKESLTLLVEELNEDDQVAIVVYGSTARTVLEPTSIARKELILNAINSLRTEDSTNAEAGLEMGYKLASKHFKNDGINRVILCSDGVANVGATDPEGIRETIRDYTAQGVYLTTVGFGMGSYNDHLMEQLANDGNGNYAYVDTLNEAQRVFVENLTGTLQVIAKDAKLQVEFNPDVVERYRLLGYENRAVADADFRNDRVDAGEVGAGHNVTALYEIVLNEQSSSDAAFTVHMRYADPETGEVSELAVPFYRDAMEQDFASAAPSLQLAMTVAGFAEQLRGNEYEQNYTLNDVYEVSQQVAPQFVNDADVQEFLQMVEQAQSL